MSNRDSRFTSEFIISGMPWVTSSLATGIKYHPFVDTAGNPKMSQWVTVKNTSTGSISFAFTSTGFSTNNFFPLSAGQSFDRDIAVFQIYVSGSAAAPYSVAASLTGINQSQFPNYLSSSTGFYVPAV